MHHHEILSTGRAAAQVRPPVNLNQAEAICHWPAGWGGYRRTDLGNIASPNGNGAAEDHVKPPGPTSAPLNALTARALFSEHELLELGAVWTGRSWVGSRRVTMLPKHNKDGLQGAQEPVLNTRDRASGYDGYPSNHSRA